MNPPDQTAAAQTQSIPPVPRPAVTEVTAEALGNEPPVAPVIPPERRISWLGWLVAILIFIVNRKFGVALFVVLIVFRQFPTIHLRNLPKAAGHFFKNLRS